MKRAPKYFPHHPEMRIAFGTWLRAEMGASCNCSLSLGVEDANSEMLTNRLMWAFLAGWKAGEAHHVMTQARRAAFLLARRKALRRVQDLTHGKAMDHEEIDDLSTQAVVAYVQYDPRGRWVAKVKIGKYTYQSRSTVSEDKAAKSLAHEIQISRIPERITLRRGAPADRLPDIKGEAVFYTIELWEGGAA